MLARQLLAEQMPGYRALPLQRVASGGTENAIFRLERARGLVISGGVIALPYYLNTNPAMVATARRGMAGVLADFA